MPPAKQQQQTNRKQIENWTGNRHYGELKNTCATVAFLNGKENTLEKHKWRIEKRERGASIRASARARLGSNEDWTAIISLLNECNCKFVGNIWVDFSSYATFFLRLSVSLFLSYVRSSFFTVRQVYMHIYFSFVHSDCLFAHFCLVACWLAWLRYYSKSLANAMQHDNGNR